MTLSDISGIVKNIIDIAISKPSNDEIETRKEIIVHFSKFSQMICANGSWDLWNRAAEKKLTVSSSELMQIRCDMNDIKAKIKDVYGFRECIKFNKILKIFDHVSRTKPTKSSNLWYYYPPSRKIIYESMEIMIQQMCIDFEKRLKEEVHSRRILDCLFWRPKEFIIDCCRTIKIKFYLEPKRLKELDENNKKEIEKKISGWFN